MPALPESRAAIQQRWEPYKETLRKLFLVEKHTLKQVGEHMTEFYNFKATESQYEYIFREWGFAKNLKSSDWMAIEYYTSKRKREGKENEVLYNDVVVPAKKVRKETLRNQGASSQRGVWVTSPKLPQGVTIRTPAASPTIQTAVLEGSQNTLQMAEDITMFDVTALDSIQSALPYPSGQIPDPADRALWTELCDLTGHIRSDIQGTTVELVNASPQWRASSPYFDELLLNQGFDLDLQEFNFQGGFEISNTLLSTTDLEWSISHIGALDASQNTFNTTPLMSHSHMSLLNWGGKHSGALYNLPYFRFQQWAIEFFRSLNSLQSPGCTIHSPLWETQNLQVQHNFTLEDRQRLLSGLLSSSTTSNSLQKLPHVKSILQDFIPERFEGDIENKLQHLFDPSSKCSLFELTEFHFYLLSNNQLTAAQVDGFLDFMTKRNSLGLLKSLLEARSPTAQVFRDKILESTIRRQDRASLQSLFDYGINKSALSGTRGGRYLQLALEHEKLDIIEYLLDNGVDVNPSLGDYSPYTIPPLHIAVRNGREEVARRLINAGANPHRKDQKGYTALSYLFYSYRKSVECVQLLLEAGANVDNEQCRDMPLLDWAYLYDRNLYRVMLPNSQQAKKSLTTSGILSAANAGRQELSQYLDSMSPVGDLERRNKLELALCRATGYFNQPIEAVCALLDLGVDPNVTIVNEESPLALAVMARDIDLADLLLDAGADINTLGVLRALAGDGDNYDGDNYDILNFLIEEGLDVKRFGGHALRYITFENDLATLKLLLNSGADINSPAAFEDGRTILQRAVDEDNLNAVKYLIDQGADINAPTSQKDGGTALQMAAACGNIEMVRLLLTLGADVNSAPSRVGGKTAIEASVDAKISSDRTEIFHLLLNQGAALNRPKLQRRYRNWNSVLTILIQNSASEDLIRCALRMGADINELGHGKGARTPLQAAAEGGSITIVQLLLDNGAKINAPPCYEYGRTALQAACSAEHSSTELVKLLLDNGAEVNAQAGFKQGLTALQGAAIRGHIKIALMLLDAGGKVNAEPAIIDGRTALDGAAENGRLDMVQVLLNLGAESKEPGASGFDGAIELAEKYHHSAVVDLLKDQSQKV